MSQAAEQGTALVIQKHADIGVVITTDGSVCDLPRESYLEPERRVIRELQLIGKPFVVLVNAADPTASGALAAAESIRQETGAPCLPVNCQTMTEEQILEILRLALEAFPLRSLGFFLPDWVMALPAGDPLPTALFEALRKAGEGAERLGDRTAVYERLRQNELIQAVRVQGEDLGKGSAEAEIELPRELYYAELSRCAGRDIQGDRELLTALAELREIRLDYDPLREALAQVRESGYGVVLPQGSEIELQEPEIVRRDGKYAVKLRASAPAIHLLRTRVECEVNPAIGGDSASEDILGFLLQGFDGDVNRIWESKIFGKSLNELAEESLTGRIQSLPENARERLRETLQRLLNEESSGLICILL